MWIGGWFVLVLVGFGGCGLGWCDLFLDLGVGVGCLVFGGFGLCWLVGVLVVVVVVVIVFVLDVDFDVVGYWCGGFFGCIGVIVEVFLVC